MNKGKYYYALFVQKCSNIIEAMARPLLFRKKGGIITENNINYGNTKNTVCDFYYLPSEEKRPVFIYIHGGGFICGTKELRKYYCYEYADKGYFVMNTNYDYAPQKKFPTQLQQLFTAIEKLLDNAEKYKLDTSKIALGGESAGAYFCSYLAAITKNKKLYEELKIDFKYKDTFDIKACVLLNGAYDEQCLSVSKFLNMGTFLHSYYDMTVKELLHIANKDKCHYFGPLKFFDEKFPPSVIGRGAHDGLDPESVHIMECLNKKNVKFISFMAKGLVGIHGFCIAARTKEGKRCLKITQEFLDEVLQ